MPLRSFLATPPRRRTILLVEDEPFVREATASILRSVGFVVLPADGAREATQAFDACLAKIDLMMTDIVLRGQSGCDLGHDLQQRSPQLVVLLTSGYSHLGYESEAPASQTYFLPKPYSKKVLIAKIERILEPPPLARAASLAG